MAYSEILAERVRQGLGEGRRIQEKRMFGGLAFMVNGKMCLGVLGEDLMARIDPEEHEAALRRKGCREMDFTGRPMRGYVFVGPAGTRSDRDLAYWTELALAFNSRAKAAKKPKTRLKPKKSI